MPRLPRASRRLLAAATLLASAPLAAQQAPAADPRVGLKGGWNDAASAIRGLELLSHTNRPDGFVNPRDAGDFGVVNTDLAFKGSLVFIGSYHGVQIWDAADPKAPVLRATITCPGGQGDVSVYGNLLFMSVEENRGRVDCGTQGVADTVSAERFRGVRIFDIANLGAIRQVAAVQTCRGSHTHTLVTDPKDKATLYVYVQGTGGVRSPNELAGCVRAGAEDPNSALFRIEVIRVPLAAPQTATVIAAPRIFADKATGAIAGLNKGGKLNETAQTTEETDQCHDITAYPAIGLAAGACSGNGILLDISNPADPRRVDEVLDQNFAYWHSATFNNAGTTVLFSDEWGGGAAPRCRTTDRPEWGADALFRLAGGKMTHAGYYKIPAAQTAQENCVAHNGSLIPIPGRDVMVQAWYQGGLSLVDFTDPAKPFEIGFFDRGPIDPAKLTLAGFWSAYWYNGRIYGSEIGRGLDILRLTPSEHLTQNEIDAALTVTTAFANVQHQDRITWPASFALARAYADQLERSKGLAPGVLGAVRLVMDRAEKGKAVDRRAQLTALAATVAKEKPASSDAGRVALLAEALEALARAK